MATCGFKNHEWIRRLCCLSFALTWLSVCVFERRHSAVCALYSFGRYDLRSRWIITKNHAKNVIGSLIIIPDDISSILNWITMVDGKKKGCKSIILETRGTVLFRWNCSLFWGTKGKTKTFVYSTVGNFINFASGLVLYHILGMIELWYTYYILRIGWIISFGSRVAFLEIQYKLVVLVINTIWWRYLYSFLLSDKFEDYLVSLTNV